MAVGSKDFSLGGLVWPGLSKLVEEAGEVIQVGGKLMGSAGDPNHFDGSNLRDRFVEELADLRAAMNVFILLNGLDEQAIFARACEKHDLFLKWHRDEVAARRG